LALGTSNLDNAYAALKAAMSYWNAKSSGSETFEYSDGNGPLKGATSAKVHGSNGNAIIDCSTYVGLVLRGIGYLDSPYYGSTAATIDPRTVVCSGDSWTETYFDKQENRFTDSLVFPTFSYQGTDGNYRVLTASDMAQYYDRLGLFWYADDSTMTPRVGDLCFFYKENADGTLKYPTRFHGISHVGIMTDDSHYLNATDYDSGGDLIRTSSSSRAPFAYARPYYGALTDGVTDSLSVNGVDLIPNVWSGVAQGSSSTSGVTFNLSGKTLTLSGTSPDRIIKDVVAKSCPLYLPAGTYKLSGFVNNSGTNTVSATHSMWGFRVYDASTGSGITGTTTSSNGANTAERTPVWDVGAGAVFTLDKPTGIYINLWLPGSRDCSTLSGTPVLYRIS
jgi:cell wall-associated NlpC family hydrolase